MSELLNPAFVDAHEPDEPSIRRLRVTSADIKVRPVHWLWADRVALGTLALLGGREGIGKSTLAYQLAADITRGRLPGTHGNDGPSSWPRPRTHGSTPSSPG